MDQRDESTIPASLLNGRLEGLSVPDLLWNLCGRRATGVLQLTARGITKKVYFDAGSIVFALSGDPNDRLGYLLLRDGLITLDHLEAATARLSGGKRLGAILVEAGDLSPEHLVRGVLGQVKSIVLGLFPLEEAEYSFAQGPLPTEEVITLGMRTAEILLEGIRQIRSFSRIRKGVGPPASRFRLNPGWHSVLDGLDIRDGERMLLQRLDECGPAGVSVEALCREVFLSNFEIYQSLWAFLVLGVVDGLDRGLYQASAGETPGNVERTTLPEILVRLCRDDLTGVLHMSRGPLERTLHIRKGQCVFATSNAVDDGLVNHLLRRGVISLSDREETARRLLSNRRVGTILVDMGVIDEEDLRQTVREQLSEIVSDTFRWEHGDFQFIEGELPTIEDITISRSVEDLVFAGVRRVTSWPRVREGCGGLGVRLVLRPDYLTVLDNATVGPEEWALISLVKTPKTLTEICRESMIGDFRTCQILWALRLLGGIGEAPLEDSVDTALGLLESTPAESPAIGEGADEPGSVAEPELEAPPEPVAEPAPPREPLPISAADESAEVISEPWRLAELRRPETDSAQEPKPQLMLDSPRDATLYIPREDVEAALRGAADTTPKFELGEPGIGLPDGDVDMRPDAPRAFEPKASVAVDEPQPLDLNGTVRLSRDAIEGALNPLAGPAERTAPIDDEPESVEQAVAQVSATVDVEPQAVTWEPPADLDAHIASFNARHVILFRALRVEIGAGATNFVRSCRVALDPGVSEMFASAGLRADGSWDSAELKRSVIEHRIANPGVGFTLLLESEIQKLRIHLGDEKAAALADQLAVIG